MPQPFPRFYIIRPQGSFVPLIPVDELPSWIQVGNWDWNDMSLFTAMAPASFSSIPRVGEYDVVCHNCNASLDRLHRSVSEQSGKTGNSSQSLRLPLRKPNKIYAGALLSQSSQEALSPLASSYVMSLTQPLFYTPGYPACFTEPPYYANLQSPFVGMGLFSLKGYRERHQARKLEKEARDNLRRPPRSKTPPSGSSTDPTNQNPANLPSSQTAEAGPSGQGQNQNNQGHQEDPDAIMPAPDDAGNAYFEPAPQHPNGPAEQETQSIGSSSKSVPQEPDSPAQKQTQPVPIPRLPLSSKPQEPVLPAEQQTQPVPIPGASSRAESQGSNHSCKHKTDSPPYRKHAPQKFEVDQSLIFPFSLSETSLDSRLRAGTQSARYEDMDTYDISRRSWTASPQPTRSSQLQGFSNRPSNASRSKKSSFF
ncbi:unnamed protein product [Aspergillus oryzae var. brunneus]|uniref:Unnamed protein product n=4 Tax=Aspergillus subgen. Circumdati TaxID=2720871 RepID=A0AAN5C0F7_ASPOZ|nr:unnamed protein product [Aspergillus oryzae]GMG32661.1 unnamed protein product [Aspergillus oryzae]GMG49982.1 unnamed protein product [Aspergillus oryzae var. brunneus]